MSAPKALHLSAQDSRVFIVEMNVPKVNDRRCSVEACGKPHIARGYCESHYRRFRGTLPPLRLPSIRQRLLASTKVNQESGCWEWQKTRRKGYGRMSIMGKLHQAHRVAAMVYLGFDLTSPLDVRHTCDNPPCCNPQHLVPGTTLENIMDAVLKGRWKSNTGEKNPKAKLTADQVIEIRHRRHNGETLKSLAADYDMSISGIAGICYGQSWSHVPDPPQPAA